MWKLELRFGHGQAYAEAILVGKFMPIEDEIDWLSKTSPCMSANGPTYS